MPHHPHPTRRVSSSGSRRQLSPSPVEGETDLPPLFSQLTFYVVPAKLDVAAVIDQIVALGGERVGKLSDARVIVTALRGRPRLERALGPGALDLPNLLDAAFVFDTHAAAIKGAQSVPSRDKYMIINEKRRSPSIELVEPRKRRKLDECRSTDSDIVPVSPTEGKPLLDKLKPEIAPFPPDIPLRSIPRLCIERASPLVCPNQDIIDSIKPIYEYREYDEGEQKNSNVLSYRRSMSILKSVPRRIRSGTEAQTLVDVGDKVKQRIDEYLSQGYISESRSILTDQRYIALEEFSSIYSIGKATAVELWNRGCRTVHDIQKLYCGEDESEEDEHEMSYDEERRERRQKRKIKERKRAGNMKRSEIVCAWLDIKDELDSTIPRSEAREIAELVMEHVNVLSPGCVWEITGGYRRGKEAVRDVDVVFAAAREDPFLIKAVCKRMFDLGIITHVLHITSRDPITPIHSHGANFDNLDKAFVILRLPGGIHRRVDLIAAPRERYAAAVLSWSGSMMFERDLRRYVEDRGYKFRAGLIEVTTNKEINFATERETFAYLGLAWVPPELRNADG